MQTTNSRALGIFLLIIFSGSIYGSLALLTPPQVVPETADSQSFSAQRALKHLKIIAKEPHSAGTSSHAQVMEYLTAYCKQMGLEVSIQDATGLRAFPGTIIAGRAQNIIARLRGQSSEKIILVMSHFDSQPQTPAAADDGAGIAAMLESIRALKAGTSLKHDVVFLMTDLEEVGLLGAEAYVNQLLNPKEVGVLLNFESRGNSGVSFTFEVSDQNGWLIREFIKAAPHPFANSLAYEIYKLLPNDTDFTMFKKSGISGLNSAFIDGFSYYHSMEDTPENINLRSVQHHGSHMLSLIRHFGQLDLKQTKAPDAIFFNLVGTWEIIYPASWDWALILITTLLYMMVLGLGFQKKRISWGGFFWGLWYFIDVIGIVILLTYVLHIGILTFYPHYSNFYGSNFYNAPIYLFSLLGLNILTFSWVFARWGRKVQPESMSLGAMALLIIAMYLIKIFLHTGAFVLYIPLIPVLLIYLILFGLQIQSKEKPLLYAVTQWLASLPLLGIWVPFVYTFFILFSWDIPYAAALLMALMSPLFVNGLSLIPNQWVNLSGAFFLLVGLIGGHITSGYSPEKPLQTNLFYALDSDVSKAYWMSRNKHLDEWNKKYIKEKEKAASDRFFGTEWPVWQDEAPLIKRKSSLLSLKQNTVRATKRTLILSFIPTPETNSVEIHFPPKTQIQKVNERFLKKEIHERGLRLRFFAPSPKGLEITCELPADAKPDIQVFDRRMGLPAPLIQAPLPTALIPGPGAYSHVTIIKHTYSF